MTSITPEKFIGSNLHITLNDSRVIDGILTVIDAFGNILLTNGHEYSRDRLNPDNVHKRLIGLISVPRTSVAKITIEERSYKHILGSNT